MNVIIIHVEFKQDVRFSNLKWVSGYDIILNCLTLVKVWENLLVQEITIGEEALYFTQLHACLQAHARFFTPIYNLQYFHVYEEL